MRRTSSTSRSSARERGLTLIEILVAIMLAVVLIAVSIPAFNAATDSDLKAVASKIAAASRACYAEAAVKNVTLRIAYDIDKQAYWIEAFPGTYRVMGSERDLDEVREEEEELAEAEKRRRELEDRYGSDEDHEAAPLAPKFVPVEVAFVEPQRMPRRIRIKGVRTPQFRQVVEDGKAYTHFFPNGWAERTLVYIEDSGGSVITLEMQPLTGRVIVHDGELDWRAVDELMEQRERR